MMLKIMLPTEVMLEAAVRKITAEGEGGSFCLLPRHIDMVAAIVPGLMSYELEDGMEKFIALDEGMLVKCGSDVLVSARHGVSGADLGQLHHLIETRYRSIDERERVTRSAVAKLESNFVRRFIDLGRQTHE